MLPTLSRVRELLNYDAHTGKFVWKARSSKHSGRTKVGEQAGTGRKDGRRVIRIDFEYYLSSRLAWLYVTGDVPLGVVDHVDGDPSNDSFRNLRDVSTKVNTQNQVNPQTNSTTGARGVYFDTSRNKYVAQIKKDMKQIYLGRFRTLEEAASAYLAAKIIYHPEARIVTST